MTLTSSYLAPIWGKVLPARIVQSESSLQSKSKMASLVADYASDSDSDQNSETNYDNQHGESSVLINETQSEENVGSLSKNYLMADGVGDSDSEEEGQDGKDVGETKDKLPTPKLEKMKVPGLGKKKKKTQPKLITSYKSNAVGSVWLNPYEKAEQKKQSVLEKHVKMTEVQILTGKKAKICRTFKQTGHCRFGKHCKYSHDIETISTCKHQETESAGPNNRPYGHKSKFEELPPPIQQGFMGTVNTLQQRSSSVHGYHQHMSSSIKGQPQQRHFKQQEQFMSGQGEEEVDDDKFQADKMRKKRVGVSQSLIPPKRALMSLGKQRAEERPWTMNDR